MLFRSGERLASGVAFTGALVTALYHGHSGSALHLGAAGGVDRQGFVLATHETFQALSLVGLFATWLAWRVRAGGPQPPRPAAAA